MKPEHPYTISTTPRHLHLLFYVDADFSAPNIRKLLLKNLKLWGGRYNPIVPLKENALEPSWEELLKYQDPDYVYYSKDVDRQAVIDLCEQFGHNPLDVIEISEDLQDIHGIHFANLMPMLPAMELPRTYNLWGIETLLADFYALNFLVEDTLPVNEGVWSWGNTELFEKHKLSLVNQASFYSINSLWSDPDMISISKLSAMNTRKAKLREAYPLHHRFELVLAGGDNGIQDFLYHWNKEFYEIPCHQSLSIVLTQEELALLLNEKGFRSVLVKYAGRDKRIDVVSFSLDDSVLAQIVTDLNTYSSFNTFAVKKISLFPFPVLQSPPIMQQDSVEKEHTQVIERSHSFISLPALSFELKYIPFLSLYGVDLKISEVRGPHTQTLRFPMRLHPELYTGQPSRVRRSRQLMLQVDRPLHQRGRLELKIPDLYNVIDIVISCPKIIGGDKYRNVYRGIRYSDGSNRLAQFIALFNNDFIFLKDLLNDKFWNDIFRELSDNNRTEGDTITFAQIIERCSGLMKDDGRILVEKGQGYNHLENLRSGLTSTMQRLTERKIFLPGYIIKCSNCSSRIWYSIDEIKHTVDCKGCSAPNFFQAENQIAYKLNHLVKNNYGMKDSRGIFMPDGNMTTIKTLIYFYSKAINSFQFIPQVDVFGCEDASKPLTDLDIIVLSAGDFYIGESKHNAKEFHTDGKKSLRHLITIASTARPDKIILACTVDEHNKLHTAAQFIRHEIRNWKHKCEVITYQSPEPTAFAAGDSYYFKDLGKLG